MDKKIGEKVSLVVLNYNDADTTTEILNRIKNYSFIDHIIVVDNQSSDNSFDRLKKFECNTIDIIRTEYNGGYGYGNNFGIIYAHKNYDPDYIIISNPDVIFENDIIPEMVKSIKSVPNCALVAPVMKDIQGNKNQVTAWQVPNALDYVLSADLFYSKIFRPTQYKGLFLTNESIKEVGCVAGSFLLIDTRLMLKYGMYDENIFLYGEETSLGIKLREHGCKTILLLKQSFIHYHSVSINKTIKSNLKKKIMMYKSRLLILERYMNVTTIGKVCAATFYTLALVEYYFYNLFSGLIHKYLK